MKIRILHVVGRMDRGGTESMLMTHYRCIDKERLQFDFAVHTNERCDFDDEILKLGGRILSVPRFNLVNYFDYKKAWHRLFESHPEYDVVHVHHFLVAGIVLPIAAEHGVKVRIVHSHNTKPPIFILKEKIMWLFHSNLIRYSTLRLACSKAAGDYLFGKNDFQVFNNAIDANAFRYNGDYRKEVRDEFHFSSDDFVVGHIGSFRTRQKNHSFIIDVFAEVVKTNPKAKLLLVGTGELQPEIIKKVNSLGLSDKCVFAGLRTDIPRLLSAMDVFLFPSFFEGLGIVLVEAQAAGLPCVVSTAIQKEACVTESIISLDLLDDIEKWRDAVLKSFNDNRENGVSAVKKGGYDVLTNVKLLEKIYDC